MDDGGDHARDGKDGVRFVAQYIISTFPSSTYLRICMPENPFCRTEMYSEFVIVLFSFGLECMDLQWLALWMWMTCII